MGGGYHGGFGILSEIARENLSIVIDNTPARSKKLSSEQIQSLSLDRVKTWAEQKRNELTGKDRKTFNTACVVYDDETGKCYYGRNGGYNEEGYKKNPILFGDSIHEGLLPRNSLNKYPVGNCAEADAINHALNDGADINHLHITTIHTTKKQFGRYKKSCENCKYAFKGKVKANYSGWKDEN